MKNKPLQIFTWHIHGSYLYYLSKGNFNIYIPTTISKEEGYYGRGETFPFGDNVIEVPASEVKNMQFDCILYQSNKNWLVDQYEILSDEQRQLPRVYLEHNTPEHSAADSRHAVKDPDVVMVHVTQFNALMWHCVNKTIKVVDHGIIPLKASYSGHLEKGVVVVNHLHQRGRKLGGDIFERVKKEVPLDLVGMGTKQYGGLGEVLHPQLPAFIAQYRFFFNPIRWTSLALSVLEAMTIGIPVVAIAATEYVTVIQNGKNGYIHTDIDYLIEKMKLLLQQPSLALQLGREGKKTAETRFNIERLVADWKATFETAIHQRHQLLSH